MREIVRVCVWGGGGFDGAGECEAGVIPVLYMCVCVGGGVDGGRECEA